LTIYCGAAAEGWFIFSPNKTFLMSTMQAQKAFRSMPASGQARKTVEMLLETYRQTTHHSNSARIGKRDTLSEFIAVEILDQMRNEAVVNGHQGVRGYFGRYPGDYADSGKAGRQSLVFTIGTLRSSPNRFVVPEDLIAFGPASRMEKDIAGVLLNTYRRTSHKENSASIGKEDSSNAFLSIDLLAQIREEAVLEGAGGVYAYFGRYPNDFIEPDLAGRQTILLTVRKIDILQWRIVVPEQLVFVGPPCPPACACGNPGQPPCPWTTD
jgi:hypothetical protein